ncbi:hypothetical protein [Vagococcus xieshaowenii]|uniref:Uncharacterized protein n=1 Tax=Vagococcus xieshaowenii TaxID=2562451 RepID=A0AAJ5EEL4_9ENTE|nr:hypothetical protein [Vagococcus xieshaowenii]QCA28234.1 hypothetical protein E4Z98_02475 [Vagococcus xieshaowenii]TFZ41889.1 hypothetical protein E4031_04655 [Vagococcus xieshaowenii]
MNYWSVIVVWLLIMTVLVIIMFITKMIIEIGEGIMAKKKLIKEIKQNFPDAELIDNKDDCLDKFRVWFGNGKGASIIKWTNLYNGDFEIMEIFGNEKDWGMADDVVRVSSIEMVIDVLKGIGGKR